MIAPPVEAVASTAAAKSGSKPFFFIIGMVKVPVPMTLAVGLPLMEPKKPEATTPPWRAAAHVAEQGGGQIGHIVADAGDAHDSAQQDEQDHIGGRGIEGSRRYRLWSDRPKR